MISTILIFFAVLVILILVHEAGHAIIARLSGCRVEEFGIFFPPRIAQKKIGETIFSLNAIPLGGFVRITGEDGGERDDPRSFAVQAKWKKISILLAGVFMNLVLAALLFSVIAGIGISVPVVDETRELPLENIQIRIVALEKTQPLQGADVQPGDALVAIEGTSVENSQDAVDRIRSFTGQELELTLRRNDELHDTTVLFEEPKEEGEPLGIGIREVGTYRVPWYMAPIEGTQKTVRAVLYTGQAFGNMFGRLVTQGEVPEDLMGPIGIASIVGAVRQQGLLPLMELMAVISVNLALINVLPIPALDGGRILFILLEAVGIRRLHGNPERIAHVVGFLIIISLIILVSIQDISRLFGS